MSSSTARTRAETERMARVARWRAFLHESYPLRYAGLIIVCFVLMKPPLVEKSAFGGSAIKLLTVLVFCCLVYLYACKHKRLTKTWIAYVAFRVSFLIPTVLNNGDILNWGYTTLAQLSLLMLIEWEMDAGKERAVRMLRCTTDLLLVYLAVNYAMIVSDGGTVTSWGVSDFAQDSYLLGIRTRVTDCVFPALMTAFLYETARGRRFGIRCGLVLLFGLAQIVQLEVVTAYVGIAAAVLFSLLTLLAKGKGSLVTMRSIAILGVVLALLVVVFRAQYLFGDFITDVLGKSVHLTGRTVLWDTAFPIVLASPVIGYGINESFGAFVPWIGGILWQAHNQYLQIMYDGGLIAVAAFFVLQLVAVRPVDRTGGSARLKMPFIATYGAFTVMAIAEIFTYNMGMFFLVLFLASKADVLFGFAKEAKTGVQSPSSCSDAHPADAVKRSAKAKGACGSARCAALRSAPSYSEDAERPVRKVEN